MNTTNASWMAPLASNYCQLAAASILGWQKTNPDVPVSELPDRDAFREIAGLDRETIPAFPSLQALQSFFRVLKGEQDVELPAGFQGVLDSVIPRRLLNQEAKDVCCRMLQGANDLFNEHYPKVKRRHEVLSLRQHDAATRQVAADYLQDQLLLPYDGLRGELMQVMNPQPHDDRRTLETRRDEIINQLASVFEEEFPFIRKLERYPNDFKNGAVDATVLLRVDGVHSTQDLNPFFSSEHTRFVKGVTLSLEMLPDIGFLERFLSLPLVQSLNHLSFMPDTISYWRAAEIASCPFLSNLESLDLSGNHIRDIGAEMIAGSEYFSNLTSLNLSRSQIGDRGAEAIVLSRFLSNLRSLELGGNTEIGHQMRARITERWPMATV